MERNERKPAVLSSVEFAHKHFFAIGFYFETSSYAHYVIAHFGKINYVWSVAVRSNQKKRQRRELINFNGFFSHFWLDLYWIQSSLLISFTAPTLIIIRLIFKRWSGMDTVVTVCKDTDRVRKICKRFHGLMNFAFQCFRRFTDTVWPFSFSVTSKRKIERKANPK